MLIVAFYGRTAEFGRFHGSSAGRIGRDHSDGEGSKDVGKGLVRDPEVIQGHPHGPIPAAILQSGEAGNQDALPAKVRRAGFDQIRDGSAFRDKAIPKKGGISRGGLPPK
jgi:hypothetical protein